MIKAITSNVNDVCFTQEDNKKGVSTKNIHKCL